MAPRFLEGLARPVALLLVVGLLSVGLGLLYGGERRVGAAAGVPVQYHAGWNLVGGPDGTVFAGSGSAYTLGLTDASYVVTAGSTPVTGGKGYWMYFPADTTVVLNGAGSSSGRTTAPAGQYIMVGNPSGVQQVRVDGADQVLVYDATTGTYHDTLTLDVGQGAWAFSAAGGTITLTAIGAALAIPSATPTPSPTPTPLPSLIIQIHALSCIGGPPVPGLPGVILFRLDAYQNGQFVAGIKLTLFVKITFTFNGRTETQTRGPNVLSNGGGVFAVVESLPRGTMVQIHIDATLDSPTGSQTASTDESCTALSP